MSIDLSKLTPAPWIADRREIEVPENFHIYDEGGHNEEDAAFIALARNAFDVMMRRGWGVEAWRVSCPSINCNLVGVFKPTLREAIQAWNAIRVEKPK